MDIRDMTHKQFSESLCSYSNKELIELQRDLDVKADLVYEVVKARNLIAELCAAEDAADIAKGIT